MNVLVGTSGYTYKWNKAIPSPFEWYLTQGFNSVEINASFYRFPTTSWNKTWLRSPSNFKFSIKVHKSITHYARLEEKAVNIFQRFKDVLKPLDNKIRFWLFQMPPSYSYSDANVNTIKNFIASFEKDKFVFEFRDNEWWKHIDKINDLGVIFCSVDAPDLPRDIICSNDIIYLRLHGRYSWYSSIYEEKELDDIIDKINTLNAKEVAIYLNNDQGMLSNGIYILHKLKINSHKDFIV